jgi:branched-chain amino acid transport system substrate-binding protein
MSLSRRHLLQGSAGAAALAFMPRIAAAEGVIKVGSIHDTSGIFDLYGKPMDKAVQLAVDEINEAGGLLGMKLEKIAYDTQSDMALYTQYAQELTRKDQVNVVHGGILSASREAIRPTLRKAETLYFYNTQYEGGVCDRNIFCTGVTPAQQSEVLLPATIKKWGPKIYTLAADYNYGQITSKWVQHYAEKNGGQIVQTDFFPLDVADFGATITKIQEAAPNIVMSVLVGGAHLSFYRQWAAAGMKAKIPMASTTLCVGNEHQVLTKEEGDGIMICYSWSAERDTPENKAFLEKWAAKVGDAKELHELAVATYSGMNLWAEGVRKAGSIDRMKVIEALETGISFVGPAGKITIDGPTHHCTTDVLLMEVKDQKMAVVEAFAQRPPVDTQAVCDLKKNPDDNQQYEIKI